MPVGAQEVPGTTSEQAPPVTAPKSRLRGPGRTWRAWPSQRAIIVAAAAGAVCKLLMAGTTYGTNDVYAYQRFADWARYLGVELYRVAWDFNHPPSMIHVLRLLGWLATATGIPFAFWLRLPGILADAGTLWLVWRLLGERIQERTYRWALLLLALAPPLLLVSGFHGNTDGVMVFFLVLSVYLTTRARDAAAGAAFGAATCFKVVPVIALPVFLLCRPSYRRLLAFGAAAGAVVVMGWTPFIFQDPGPILVRVFGYRSLFGHWGLTYLAVRLAQASPAWQPIVTALEAYGTYLQLGAIVALSLWMNRGRRRPELFAQVGLVLLLFLSVSSGFSVQYLAWPAPFVVWLGALPALLYFAASGVFLFLVYDLWSHGFPWYLADSNLVGDYQGHLDYSQVVCWLTVIVMLWAAWRQVRTGTTLEETLRRRVPARVARMAIASIALVALAYPLGALKVSASGAGVARRALAAIRARDSLDLSYLLYQRGRYRDTIEAASETLKLVPDSAEAYNNIAAAHAALREWDEAIRAAREALRIRPDFPLARNNLSWAESERADRGGRR